jgi:AcrR family transcriptional regulator
VAIGRPRGFNADAALDQALTLFWTKGYEGTSLMDLVDAIGINKPSLYAAFGSKEELFLKALGRFQELLDEVATPALTLPSARCAIEAFLRALATFQSTPGSPQGCLLVQGALAGSEDSTRITQILSEARECGVGMIHKCLERARKQREIPASTDIKALARFFGTISQGISVQAAGGVPTDALHETISIAMRCWPETRNHRSERAVERTRNTVVQKGVHRKVDDAA